MYTYKPTKTCVSILVILLLNACAAPLHKYFYEPTKGSAERLQTEEAKDILTALYLNCQKTPHLNVKDFKLFDDRIEIGGQLHRFDDIEDIKMTIHDQFDSPNVYYLTYQSINRKVLMSFPYCARGEWSVENSHKVADALLKLKLDSEDKAKLEAVEFQNAVKAYHSSARKPELPEEARKYKIQAEAAIKDKRFFVSAERYNQALQIAPWWPEGHFNRAIVLSELKRFKEAILEMNRYLQLTPEAPDARAAKDKIYEWEGYK